MVGQPSQEHGVNGNGEQGTHDVLDCSRPGSEQGAVAVHSDAGVFPPVLPLVLEERCDWLEQNPAQFNPIIPNENLEVNPNSDRAQFNRIYPKQTMNKYRGDRMQFRPEHKSYLTQ